MANERQVRDWVVECLRRHMSPDVLEVRPEMKEGDGEFLTIHTRKAGTNAAGAVFTATIEWLIGPVEDD